jgi:RNA polymerase sigma factor (sigma-70 family)
MPVVGDDPLGALAFAARDGDPAALEALVAAVQDDVYRLALRMLWHPEDAKDASQEALVRIVTRVASFRGDSSFRTWAYRVASNCILSFRKSRVERENLTFRRFAQDLHEGLAEPASGSPSDRLLAEEVKLGCTLGMLQCLDRDHRLAYILSDVLELDGDNAAVVCGISPAAFRKRASRARGRLRDFVSVHCGLVNADAACRCERRVSVAVRIGRVDPQALMFVGSRVEAAMGEMEQLHDLASLMRSHPDYRAPHDVAERVRRLISTGGYTLLE